MSLEDYEAFEDYDIHVQPSVIFHRRNAEIWGWVLVSLGIITGACSILIQHFLRLRLVAGAPRYPLFPLIIGLGILLLQSITTCIAVVVRSLRDDVKPQFNLQQLVFKFNLVLVAAVRPLNLVAVGGLATALGMAHLLYLIFFRMRDWYSNAVMATSFCTVALFSCIGLGNNKGLAVTAGVTLFLMSFRSAYLRRWMTCISLILASSAGFVLPSVNSPIPFTVLSSMALLCFVADNGVEGTKVLAELISTFSGRQKRRRWTACVTTGDFDPLLIQE
jgi:hypothetical protein